ncbi:MAG: PqqD family protein [Acidobacteriota bacterium]
MTQTWRLRREVRFRRVAGEGVVVLLQAREVLVLNGTGAQVLGLLREGRSMAAIREAFQHRYSVAPEQIQADLERFIDELAEANVLTEASVLEPRQDETPEADASQPRAAASPGRPASAEETTRGL